MIYFETRQKTVVKSKWPIGELFWFLGQEGRLGGPRRSRQTCRTSHWVDSHIYLIGPQKNICLVLWWFLRQFRFEGDQGGYFWVKGGRGGGGGAPEKSQGVTWGQGGRLRDLMEMKQCFPTSRGKLIVPWYNYKTFPKSVWTKTFLLEKLFPSSENSIFFGKKTQFCKNNKKL